MNSPLSASPSTMWGAVTGFFLSPVIALLLQSGWSANIKRAVSFAIYLLVAFGASYFTGKLDFSHWQETLLTIIYTATAGYTGHKALWSGVSESIETATNLNGGAGERENGRQPQG